MCFSLIILLKGGMIKMHWLGKTAIVLANIGAINWGLDYFGWNLVEALVGNWPAVATTVYFIVAICGIYGLVKVFTK